MIDLPMIECVSVQFFIPYLSSSPYLFSQWPCCSGEIGKKEHRTELQTIYTKDLFRFAKACLELATLNGNADKISWCKYLTRTQ